MRVHRIASLWLLLQTALGMPFPSQAQAQALPADANASPAAAPAQPGMPAARPRQMHSTEEGTPTLQELRTQFADVLVAAPPTALDQRRVEEKLRQVEAAMPAFHLPRPVLLPQVLRFINAELARQQVRWRVAVDLAQAQAPALPAADAPAGGQDGLHALHLGALCHAVPESPALVRALDAGTLGGMLRALAEGLPADVMFVMSEDRTGADAGQEGRLVLRLRPPAGRPPLGVHATQEEMRRTYADVLLPASTVLGREGRLQNYDPRAKAVWHRLYALQPARRLPPPVLVPQMIRYLNAELAAQNLPHQVLLQLNPREDEDVDVYYDDELCGMLPFHAEREAALRSGTLGDILASMQILHFISFSQRKDGRIVLRHRVDDDDFLDDNGLPFDEEKKKEEPKPLPGR